MLSTCQKSFGLGLCIVLGASCRMDMHDAPRYEPLEASTFFADGMSGRQPVEGTVAVGHLKEDTYFETGKLDDGSFGDRLPFELTEADLDRGQQRYNIFCSPCHGEAGNGMGMVVQRGLKQPPSFHEQRLRDMSLGYFFNTITNGFGVMFDYRERVKPRDRWLISAYIRTLQLSQNATMNGLEANDQAGLRAVK